MEQDIFNRPKITKYALSISSVSQSDLNQSLVPISPGFDFLGFSGFVMRFICWGIFTKQRMQTGES